jgi:hypothetical protein
MRKFTRLGLKPLPLKIDLTKRTPYPGLNHLDPRNNL